MSVRHVIGLIICIGVFVAFHYIGMIWSLADFHPGSDVDIPAHLHHKARVGILMCSIFEVPTMWIFSGTQHYKFAALFQWLLLPAFYGIIFYCLYVLVRRPSRIAHRNV